MATTVFAKTNIVYGDDNRLEAHESPDFIQELGNSTAVMIPTSKLVPVMGYFMLPPSTLKEDMNLCPGERFENQLSAGLCSGFLVGPDLLVTAGHCVTSEFDCAKYSWVFDYKVKKETNRADVLSSRDNVYKCKRVIDAKLEVTATGKVDYALIQLDRVAAGRKPLKYRSEGKIADDAEVFVIGYPSGLPQKYAPDAQLVQNSDEHFFQANLDTFGGNSGSSVFNTVTNEVEGILVRGAKDYETVQIQVEVPNDTTKEDGPAVVQVEEVVGEPTVEQEVVPAKKYVTRTCRRVHTTAHEITDLGKYGESVSRITDIPALKYRDLLMLAAKEGDLAKIKELVEKKVDLLITDNDNNTALAYATMGGHSEVVDYIVKQTTKPAADAESVATVVDEATATEESTEQETTQSTEGNGSEGDSAVDAAN